eukprot:9442702-Pyramimonas_sp.AAC.1
MAEMQQQVFSDQSGMFKHQQGDNLNRSRAIFTELCERLPGAKWPERGPSSSGKFGQAVACDCTGAPIRSPSTQTGSQPRS